MFWDFWTNGNRRALRKKPFPEAWRQIVKSDVPYFKRLPQNRQTELLGHILVFLDEKHFEGCGGLKLTDKMRLVVAAQACVLLLNRKTNYFSELSSILLYPSTFVVKTRHYNEHGIITEGMQERLGESWRHGTVVLAWDDAQSGVCNEHDGYNVILHEFAHQLDEENGDANGTPLLQSRAQYKRWGKVFDKEFYKLQKAAQRGQKTFLDPYGATHPAEFFAVATEIFFERPKLLRQKHFDLYQELCEYYQQDPLQYF